MPRTFSKHPFSELSSFLPTFVVAKVRERLEEEKENVNSEHILYAEIQGSIERPSQDVEKRVMFWLSDEKCFHDIYVGGSSCWAEPGGQYLSFEAIAEELLPPRSERDPFLWWIVLRPEEKGQMFTIYKVDIVPEHEVTEDFPE